MRNNLITVLKGMIVGGTMLVPGASGGSMAMILGVYDRLITSVSSFFKDIKGNLIFLLLFALGGGAGMLLFAKPLLQLIETYPVPMLYFFLGAVAGGVPLILKEAKLERFTWKAPVWILVGMVCVLLCSLLPSAGETGTQTGLVAALSLLAAGVIAAVALVLPGISVSYLLLMLGLYDEMMKAITELYFPFLIPLGVGLLLGVILTTKILERAMKEHPQATYLVILGFVVASMLEVFPGFPTGIQIPVSLLTLAAGFGVIRFLSIYTGEEG